MKKEFGFMAWVCLMAILFSASSASALDGYSRMGRTEIYGMVQTMGGDTASEGWMELTVDDFVAGGFGIGYNLLDNFNLNAEMYFGSTDIETPAWIGPFKMDADVLGFNANMDYNILFGPFTPLVTVGIGYIRFDGDHGVEETDFSYNLGGGFRYDVYPFFFKAIYRATWTQLEDTDDDLMLDGVTAFVGYMF
jgi:opacity protein-like surface antigen